MNSLNTLIIGLGKIGCLYDYEIPFSFDNPKSSKYISTHSRAVACHPNFKFICGIDKNFEARNLFTKKYKAPVFKNIYDWSKSKEFKNPDLAIIAIPPNYQVDLLKQLLEICVPKFLLLEKPIAINSKDLFKVKRICEKYENLTVLVNYIRCYLPVVNKLKDILNSGQLGDFLHGNLIYGKGLLNNASHFINLAELLIGPFTLKKKESTIAKCFDYDEEINIVLNLKKDSNASLNVVSISRFGLVAGELDLWFSKGRVLWPNNEKNIFIWTPEEKKTNNSKYYELNNNPKKISTDIDHYQIHVLNYIYSLSNQISRKDLLCSLNSGSKTLKLLLDN